jgi:hypothetical protein
MHCQIKLDLAIARMSTKEKTIKQVNFHSNVDEVVAIKVIDLKK